MKNEIQKSQAAPEVDFKLSLKLSLYHTALESTGGVNICLFIHNMKWTLAMIYPLW